MTPHVIGPADVYDRVLVVERMVNHLFVVGVVLCACIALLIMAVIAKMYYNKVIFTGFRLRADRLLDLAEKHGDLTDTIIRTNTRELKAEVKEAAAEVTEKVPGKVVEEIARSAVPPAPSWKPGDGDRRTSGHTPEAFVRPDLPAPVPPTYPPGMTPGNGPG